MGGHATLRMCARLQAEKGNEHRSGEGRAPQQELFHFVFSENQN
jgi:hypothetical protein